MRAVLPETKRRTEQTPARRRYAVTLRQKDKHGAVNVVSLLRNFTLEQAKKAQKGDRGIILVFMIPLCVMSTSEEQKNRTAQPTRHPAL
jgi:hypothetical protein